MSSYEERIRRTKDGILGALKAGSEPQDVGRDIASYISPDTQIPQDGSVKLLSSQQHAFLGNVLASIAGDLGREAAEKGVPLMEYTPPATSIPAPVMPLLLDAVLWLAGRGTIHGGVPAALLEQVLESTPVSQCAVPFAYLEGHLNAFRAPTVRQRASLTLQRACNMLLHRLSKSQEARLAGRVLLFLARMLPLTERSGVNLQGVFDTDNMTPVEQVEDGTLDSMGKPVDVEFYSSFWGLQAVFADPPTAVGRWVEVRKSIRLALERMKEEPIRLTETATRGGSSLRISAKYLSGSRLLELQLQDATFRRHFLVQCLILFQFLKAPHPTKQAWPAMKPRQQEDVQSLEGAVLEALSGIPENGPQFSASIKRVLDEEEAWAVWKQAGCPKEPFERPDADPLKPLDGPLGPPYKRRKLGPEAYYGVSLGTDELDRLWNLTEGNINGLAAEDRGGFKTVGQLMEPVIEEMNNPDEAMDGGVSKSTMYSWRTLRMVSRVNLRAFVASVQAGGDLQLAARMLYPSRCPPKPTENEAAKPPMPPPRVEAATNQAAPMGEDQLSVHETDATNPALPSYEQEGAPANVPESKPGLSNLGDEPSPSMASGLHSPSPVTAPQDEGEHSDGKDGTVQAESGDERSEREQESEILEDEETR